MSIEKLGIARRAQLRYKRGERALDTLNEERRAAFLEALADHTQAAVAEHVGVTPQALNEFVKREPKVKS